MQASKQICVIAVAASLGLGAAVATTAVAADSPDHSASVTAAVSDTWITTKVKAELATTKGVNSTDVSVETVNGKVTLTGVLPTDIDVKKAVAAAKSVKGVKDVDSSGLKVK